MKKITAILAALIMIGSFFFGGAVTSAAESEGGRAFDSSPVLEDLTNSVNENGEPFDITDYPYDEDGQTGLVTFTEYAYSYAENMRGYWGLYIYIYNPSGQEIITDSELNKAQLAVAYNAEGNPSEFEKFDLKFCSKSTGDYNNLFYKFRIEDHMSADGKTIAERVNSNARRYDLSGFELLTAGETNAHDYGVGGSYIFSGYAAGYGPDITAESTLRCEIKEMETLKTAVHSTVYRPEGSYHNGEQDQLNSVYFTVPNYFYEEYGAIDSVVAEWYEYRTNPIFITEDETAANEFSEYVGVDVYATDYEEIIDAVISESSGTGIHWVERAWEYNLRGENPNDIPARNILSAVFWTRGGRHEDYTVSAEDLQEYFLETSAKTGGELINGKYSRSLFSDEVDEGHTMGYNRKEVFSGDMHSLTSYYLTQNWWQKWFGTSTEHVQEYESIRAIEDFGEEDENIFSQSDEEIAAKLYIDKGDVGDLKNTFQTAVANDSRLVILRFSTGKYYSYPASYSLESDNKEDSEMRVMYADKSYVAEEPVYLDFDVISVTFEKDGIYTVIAAVSDPVDIFGPVTPPLSKDPLGGSGLTLEEIVILIIIAVVVIIAVVITLKLIGKALSRPKTTVNVSVGGEKSTTKPPSRKKSKKKGERKR